MKDLNLIPKSYFENKKKKRKKVLIIFACIAGVLIVIFSFVWPIRTQYILKKRVEEANKKTSETSGFAEKKNLLDSLEDVYNTREEEALKVSGYENNVLKVFEFIQLSMPEKMFVKEYKFTGKDSERELTISCSLDSKEDAIYFVNNLRKENYFKKVGIASIGSTNQLEVKSDGKLTAVVTLNY